MLWVLRLPLYAAVFYAIFLASLYVFQRRLMYFPSLVRASVHALDLPAAKALHLVTSDGERIAAWYLPATGKHPLFLYFHGNGGSLADRVDILRRLSSDGSGFLAIDYRGYGGSTGWPSEKGLILDGEAAYREAVALGYTADRIVIIGESIGTGVAVAVAATHPAHALVLDSGFSSAADVAEPAFKLLPVRLLMKDTYDSLSRIGQVSEPKLFLHGSADVIIPIALDRKLFDAAPEPKTFIELKGRGHVVLFGADVPGMVRDWLATFPPSAASQSSFSTR